jgi:predicted secreted protein
MAGVDGFGTQYQRGDGGSPEVFTALASVTNISGPGLSRETLDVSAHDSPEQWTEHIGSMKDGGEVSLDLNYDPAVHDDLVADLDDDEPRNYRLVFPVSPAVTWSFAAIMTGFEPSAPYDDKLSATATYKVSGKPTLS